MIINRVEIIDYTNLLNPRLLLLLGVEASFSVQDKGQTLKVFIQKRDDDESI